MPPISQKGRFITLCTSKDSKQDRMKSLRDNKRACAGMTLL